MWKSEDLGLGLSDVKAQPLLTSRSLLEYGNTLESAQTPPCRAAKGVRHSWSTLGGARQLWLNQALSGGWGL